MTQNNPKAKPYTIIMATNSSFNVGPKRWPLSVPTEKLISEKHSQYTKPTLSAKDLVAQALEKPFGFESMRRAITPDDHVSIVVDDQLPCLAEMLTAIFEHLISAGVQPDAVTIVLSPPASNQGFIDDLPDEFADVKVEVHNPADEKRHAYLATTNGERRVYLNRTVVESDFIIVLTGRRFDPVIGFIGAVDAIFPALSNAKTIEEFQGKPPAENPFAEKSEQTESEEIAWLLGTPFFIQVIEGEGNAIHAVVAGLANSVGEGVRLQKERWVSVFEKRADLVIASAIGDETALSNALANAARVVAVNGRIVLLANVPTRFSEAFGIIRKSTDMAVAAKTILSEKPDGTAAAVLWAFATRSAKVSLGPDWSKSLAEDFFATPISNSKELESLVANSKSIIVLNDAHKMYSTVKS